MDDKSSKTEADAAQMLREADNSAQEMLNDTKTWVNTVEANETANIQVPANAADTVHKELINVQAPNSVVAEKVGKTETTEQEKYSNPADISVDPTTIELLTDGFISKFLPSLQKAKTTIDQIKTSQSVLIETVQQEISKFTECQAMNQLEKTMAKAKIYQSKLVKLHREMTSLHEKSQKLKKRALKLQQQKQKEELTRAQHLEIEYEKERMLTARIVPASE